MPPLQPPPFRQIWADKNGRVPAGPVQDFLIAQQQAIVAGTAPADARYLVAAANADLTDEVNLGALASGHLKIAVAIGVATVSSSATVPSSDLTGALPGAVVSATIWNGPVRLRAFTVATLPAGTAGDLAYATDLLLPGFLAVAVGGGAVVGPVFYNGTNWVTF